ncbi:sugar ABC transporter permease [Frankia sp. CNm7]|uniref:Sugar ABC transporter permease n=1 Tax=Frankia nepalensis TaxID=1836974 RepID=A0A937RGR1_9ACTN|nr:sugar ABC transporter permease [Frankia nepalensis]MBL7497284.1 sugar ABC transporter permease [Frankia nepalensis]MBL7515471.1 sugar ABC transporter permease [Frankia nepalensis]MBL7519929.1 sugar ABC transporter permease [Frankia nepalensis]MBL7631911.1 sugar ABC transporter permease [Frankia nepalensis]
MTTLAPTASSVDASPPPAGARRRRNAAIRRVTGVTAPYGFVAPFFLIFLVFGLFPMLYTFWVSMHDRSMLSRTSGEWVGLQNYRDLLGDKFFWNAVQNTFELMLLCTVPQLVLALVMAHILNARLRGRTLFRMGILLPNITSIVAVTIVFGQLFSKDYGLINWALGLFGVDKINWQAGDWTSKIAIASMVIWRWTGYNALIYLAAMQAIPKEQFEAAAIDGAGTWRQLWHVTLPALRPTIAFTALVSIIGQIQLFTEPLLFDTGPGSVTGGTSRQFQTLALLLYEEGFRLFHFGYASAIAWLMFLLTVLLALLAYLVTRSGALVGGVRHAGAGRGRWFRAGRGRTVGARPAAARATRRTSRSDGAAEPAGTPSVATAAATPSVATAAGTPDLVKRAGTPGSPESVGTPPTTQPTPPPSGGTPGGTS